MRIDLFFSLPDERQRLFFVGLKSLKIGQGGDARIVRLLGVDPHTVAKVRRELLQRNIAAQAANRKNTESGLQHKPGHRARRNEDTVSS